MVLLCKTTSIAARGGSQDDGSYTMFPQIAQFEALPTSPYHHHFAHVSFRTAFLASFGGLFLWLRGGWWALGRW